MLIDKLLLIPLKVNANAPPANTWWEVRANLWNFKGREVLFNLQNSLGRALGPV